MSKGYARRFGAIAMVLATAGALAVGSPAGQSGATPLRIHAEFTSDLIAPQDQPPDCPPPLLLVIGHGIGSGTHISDHAVGVAQECSFPSGNDFSVTGKGSYTTPDGSVLYLNYSEVSENPFTTPPPWTLHDHGQWTINGDLSTGRFHGASGSGTITAEVPITCESYFPFPTNCSAPVFADYIGTISFASGH